MSEEHEVAEVYRDEWWPVFTCGICHKWVSGDPDDESRDLTTARPVVHMKSIRKDDWDAQSARLSWYKEALERIYDDECENVVQGWQDDPCSPDDRGECYRCIARRALEDDPKGTTDGK